VARVEPGLRRGSTITAFSNAYYPPATPLGQNPAWQEVNKQLNATLNFNIVAPADLHILFYAALWGAPNNWALDANTGKLTKNFEAPEFKAAVGHARRGLKNNPAYRFIPCRHLPRSRAASRPTFLVRASCRPMRSKRPAMNAYGN